MRLQEKLKRKEAGVERRSTKNEEKASRRVEAHRKGDWKKVAEIDRRDRKMGAQMRLERQEFLARKRRATEARKRRNCDPASDTEN